MATHPRRSTGIDPAQSDCARFVGLCTSCGFSESHANARGSVFWRCRLPDANGTSGRYPRLPVRNCAGFEPPYGRGQRESGP